MIKILTQIKIRSITKIKITCLFNNFARFFSHLTCVNWYGFHSRHLSATKAIGPANGHMAEHTVNRCVKLEIVRC